MTSAGFDGLCELVRSTATSGVARRALLLCTDRLPASEVRAEQVSGARAALAALNGADRAKWHELPGGSVVVSWRGDQPRLVEQAMDGVARILSKNPLDAPPLGELVRLFDLPKSGDALLTAASARISAERVAAPPIHTQPVTAPALQPLQPAELDRLEQSLARTDVSRFARRRPVSYFNGSDAQLAWEERTLSLPELIDAVAPGRDAKSDVWLFRRLTRVLDRRMLAILSDTSELRGARPFSITLNVASVLSPEFLRFDAALPTALRSRVVICLLPADVASDASAFSFARNFARGRSYRVCLRAVSSTLLPALDVAALDLDFIQLIWSPDLAEVTALPPSGRTRWIVGQPLTEAAKAWGVQRGITLFTMPPTS